MESTRPQISRKLIAITPLLLVAGIVAQLVLLVAAIIVYVPALVWPGILDGCYQWITHRMVRMFARGIVGHRRKIEAGT